MTNKKIVVIDDEKQLCLLIKNILEADHKMEVFMAHDGAAGKELCIQIEPDLIFLDLVMPQERGDKVLEFLRSTPKTKDIPVVLISGLEEEKPLQELSQVLTFNMPKPFTKQMLLEITEKIIGKE